MTFFADHIAHANHATVIGTAPDYTYVPDHHINAQTAPGVELTF